MNVVDGRSSREDGLFNDRRSHASMDFYESLTSPGRAECTSVTFSGQSRRDADVSESPEDELNRHFDAVARNVSNGSLRCEQNANEDASLKDFVTDSRELHPTSTKVDSTGEIASSVSQLSLPVRCNTLQNNAAFDEHHQVSFNLYSTVATTITSAAAAAAASVAMTTPDSPSAVKQLNASPVINA